MGVVDCKFKELSKCFDIMYSITELRRTVFVYLLKGHPLSTYAKFSEKLTFLIP